MLLVESAMFFNVSEAVSFEFMFHSIQKLTNTRSESHRAMIRHFVTTL